MSETITLKQLVYGRKIRIEENLKNQQIKLDNEEIIKKQVAIRLIKNSMADKNDDLEWNE